MTTKQMKNKQELMIKEGIDLFNRRIEQADQQLSVINTAIQDIRDICINRGITPIDLEQAQAEADEYKLYKAKLEECLQQISKSKTLDQKSMLIGVMVQISEPIPKANRSLTIIEGDDQ